MVKLIVLGLSGAGRVRLTDTSGLFIDTLGIFTDKDPSVIAFYIVVTHRFGFLAWSLKRHFANTVGEGQFYVLIIQIHLT